MAGYRDLKVWQSGMTLAKRVYHLTSQFPLGERFGLTSQLRQSAISIPSNIAEGHARNTKAEMTRFSGIAQGSIAEIETQLLLAADLGFANTTEITEVLNIAEEVGRMLRGLIRSNSTRSG